MMKNPVVTALLLCAVAAVVASATVVHETKLYDTHLQDSVHDAKIMSQMNAMTAKADTLHGLTNEFQAHSDDVHIQASLIERRGRGGSKGGVKSKRGGKSKRGKKSKRGGAKKFRLFRSGRKASKKGGRRAGRRGGRKAKAVKRGHADELRMFARNKGERNTKRAKVNAAAKTRNAKAHGDRKLKSLNHKKKLWFKRAKNLALKAVKVSGVLDKLGNILRRKNRRNTKKHQRRERKISKTLAKLKRDKRRLMKKQKKAVKKALNFKKKAKKLAKKANKKEKKKAKKAKKAAKKALKKAGKNKLMKLKKKLSKLKHKGDMMKMKKKRSKGRSSKKFRTSKKSRRPMTQDELIRQKKFESFQAAARHEENAVNAARARILKLKTAVHSMSDKLAKDNANYNTAHHTNIDPLTAVDAFNKDRTPGYMKVVVPEYPATHKDEKIAKKIMTKWNGDRDAMQTEALIWRLAGGYLEKDSQITNPHISQEEVSAQQAMGKYGDQFEHRNEDGEVVEDEAEAADANDRDE